MMSAIRVHNVSKSHRKVQVLSGVNLVIDEGRSYGIIGPNGSGKSVLFKLMAGFAAPDTGTVEIDPKYLSPGRTFPQGFGVIIDQPGYLAHKTGLANLLTLAKIRNIVGETEVRETMARLGLDPDNKAKVGNYSLGMKQKLSIAQSIMEGQRLLLLDEPFNALDHESVLNLRKILRDHVAGGGTLVFTSHNQEDVDVLAEIVYRIQDARVDQVLKTP